MPTKTKNLKMLMHSEMDRLTKGIGLSKHEGKKIYRAECEKYDKTWNPSKSDLVHSCKTADAYRDTINQFSNFIKSEHGEIWKTHDLNSITKNTAYDFLKSKEEQGCSAYTISRHMAALNKVLNLELNKKEGHLIKRSHNEISRSRGPKEHDSAKRDAANKEQMDITRAFGTRRESICSSNYSLRPSNFFKNDQKLYVSVIEKGGRYSEHVCLPSKAAEIEKFLENRGIIPLERTCLISSDLSNLKSKELFLETYWDREEVKLFDTFDKKCDNHACRSEYATSLYKELLEEKLKNGYEMKADYRGYEKEIISEVSKNLGHNRLSVVVEHYLRL